jgi:molybdate transport system ATP-binding protein
MITVELLKTRGDFTVNASFAAPDWGVTALFGPSGAGKTSIISMIAGLLRPEKGSIQVAGKTLYDSRSGVHLPPEKRRIGYVFQDGRLFPHLSVQGNLTYGMQRTPVAHRYVTLDRIVTLLGIGHLLSRKPAGLSGGEKQRVAIGRALLASPTLLLMDEPLASLDSRRKAEVLPFIATLARQLAVPVIYVSHDLYEIKALADHVVLMADGRVVAADSVERLAARGDLTPVCRPVAPNEDTGTLTW